MKYHIAELANGIRTVFRHSRSPVAHIGLTTGTGSRHEADDEQGLAHFIEHTIFKGTKKRKAYHILSRLENVGGEMNAFTSKEETCFHASVACGHLERATELLSDVFQNSVFPEKEVNREKEVVLDEIRYYLDLPDESITDDFEEKVFRGHPIGRNILGTPEHIKSFTGKKIQEFISNKYCSRRTIISCIACMEPEKWLNLATRYFSDAKMPGVYTKPKSFVGYKTFNLQLTRDTQQAHCMIGAPAYSLYDKRNTGLILLNNLLGGPCNNSWLNLALRERHGLSYNVESVFTPYSDSGILMIYFGADERCVPKAMGLIKKEMRRMREKKLGTLQLHRAKQQLMGQIAMAHESNMSVMLAMGKNLLVHDRVQTLEEINAKINGLDASSLLEIAAEVFDEQRMSKLIYSKNEIPGL
jgi:predicted Zn-dependent peptidase